MATIRIYGGILDFAMLANSPQQSSALWHKHRAAGLFMRTLENLPGQA